MVLAGIGIAFIGAGALGGTFPLWKSATLSPDAIRRRVYWTGAILGVLFLFVSQLPDLKSATLLSTGVGLGLVFIAFNWTSHIKVGGRIFAAFNSSRKPDRPPALRSDPSDD